MNKTKKVTITITSHQQNKARNMSKNLFGKQNVSGFIGFLIEQYSKDTKN